MRKINLKIKLEIWILLLLIIVVDVNAMEYGPNYDKSCSDGICTYNIYSNIKYYQENGIWKEINESFDIVNCATGYNSCVDKNLYQFNINNSYVAPLIIYNNTRVSFDLINLSVFTKSYPVAEISKNTVVYRNIYPGVDLRYTYLPTKVKEEIIINNKSILDFITSDIIIDFKINSFNNNVTINNNSIVLSYSNKDRLTISDLMAYDKFDFISLNFTATKIENEINFKLTMPIDWLKNESRVYPIIIDPTIKLADVDIRWNGYIRKDENAVTWNRTNNPNDFLQTGRQKITVPGNPPSITRRDFRASIEWNINPLPVDSEFIDINLTIFVEQVGTHGNELINISHMDGNNDTYPDTNTGNENFFNDTGNGTLYNVTNLTLGFNSINLTSASIDIQNKLQNNIFIFGIGIDGLNINANPSDINNAHISSRDDIEIAQRPLLTFKIKAADESQGDISIKKGIFKETPNARVFNERQVYIRLANGSQQFGRFDKYTIYGKKRWAINYVTSLIDPLTDMNNITNIFFVLEMIDLTQLQINSTVKDFIKGTL